MKLRFRSVESKQTFKLEVPGSCSLHQVKQALCSQISSSSSPAPSTVHFSLNRKDELHSVSQDETLQSLGVASGDLIFYALHSGVFVPQTLESTSQFRKQVQGPVQEQLVQREESESRDGTSNSESHALDPVSRQRKAESEVSETIDPDAAKIEDDSVRILQHGSMKIGQGEFDLDESGLVDSANPNQEENLESTEAKEHCNEDGSSQFTTDCRFSVPSFLRKVLRDELRGDSSDHRLLVVAIHAVLMESGFVRFDPVSLKGVERFDLPDNAFSASLWYTLPQLIDAPSEVVEYIVLKFQLLGIFLNVYGSLHGRGHASHRICLSEKKFAPIIESVWEHYDYFKRTNGPGGCNNSKFYPEGEILEFWKIVKDGLALPLLIDLCERAGMAPPSCLIRLPSELKFKILELLSAIDLAKVACVCSELSYLASNNDIWKQKYVEEFGVVPEQPGGYWRDKFVTMWESRKKRKRVNSLWRGYPSIDRPFYFPVRRDPQPLGFPQFVGGDYDRFPVLGMPVPRRQPSLTQHPLEANFVPNCRLGGFHDLE